ncbi:MAG: GNAT family N-acetyltransferase [Raoultibacter sp.]|jgi:L-amino acid N-acyltransferase YncA
MIEVRPYILSDIEQMITVWNEVVHAGNAFPQETSLSNESANLFFEEQSLCAVAVEEGVVLGLYILHPNNIGRCSHIANASYAVSSASRGKRIGRSLVIDSLNRCQQLGFKGLQFNAVVDSNLAARALYEDLGFTHIGCVPQGFLMKDGSYEDTHIYFHATDA